MNLALFTVSADLSASADPRSSVNVRLLGVAVVVLDTNQPRGTRGNAEVFVGILGGENRCTLQRHQPQPLSHALWLFLIFVCLMFDKVCSHWPKSLPCKCLPNGIVTNCCHRPIISPSIEFLLSRNPSGNIFLYTQKQNDAPGCR